MSLEIFIETPSNPLTIAEIANKIVTNALS